METVAYLTQTSSGANKLAAGVTHSIRSLWHCCCDYEVTDGSARVLEQLEADRWGIAKLCVRML